MVCSGLGARSFANRPGLYLERSGAEWRSFQSCFTVRAVEMQRLTRMKRFAVEFAASRCRQGEDVGTEQ